jgi:hypothetical protein
MLDLAKLPVQVTVGLASRYCAGRINPYTVVVAQALCSSFQLAPAGWKNVENAIAKLSMVGTLGETLEIGFGIEDVVRSMAKSMQGATCLALCAALKDCYSDDVAIEVLLELARLSKVEGQWMPSSLEWKNLLNACAGCLSSTTFPTRAEVFMQIPNDQERLGSYQVFEATARNLRGCSSPKSIAEALFAISQITRKELHAITIIGSADAGWLGAISEWLLDLKVSIVHSNGTVFYTNHGDVGSDQVQIIYKPVGEGASTNIQCVGRTYVLEDVTKLFSQEGRHLDVAVVSGRVEWKDSLKSSFLLDFKNLMQIPQAFGELLGSAARIFKALASGDNYFPYLPRLSCSSYCDQSYGVGFVQSSMAWFPELKKLKEKMEVAVASDLKEALRMYERCISTIRAHCGCLACQCPWNGFDIGEDEEMTPDPDQQSESDTSSLAEIVDDFDPDKYCEVILAETVITLCRSLANVSLKDKGLCPTRAGFELAYGRQLNTRRSAMSGKQAIRTLGQIVFCMDFDANFSIGTLEGEEGIEMRLHSVLELFSGRRASFTSRGVSAVCQNGICAFLGILQEVSIDKNDVGRISVIPGRIYHEKKVYTRLEDRIILRQPGEDFSGMVRIVELGKPYEDVKLSIRETSSALQCLLQIRETPENDTFISVGPAHLASLLGTRRGLVICKQRQSPRTRRCARARDLSADQAALLGSQNVQFDINDKKINILRCGEPSTSVAAISDAAYLELKCSLFIVEDECLDCCVNTALGNDRPEKSQFCFFQTRIK